MHEKETRSRAAWERKRNSTQQTKEQAINRAMRSLAMRAHSEKELVDKLTHAGYDERTIAEVMETLTTNNLVNDADFASQWTSHRANRGLGPYRIAYELRQKGIEKESLDEALAQLGEEDLLRSATAVALKRLRRGGENAHRRTLDALNRRGFSYSLAKQALLQAAEIIDHDD